MADTTKANHPEQSEEEYKYMKLTSTGLSISNDSKPETFTTAIKVSRTAIVFNRLFRIVFGDITIEELIRRIIMEVLKDFLEFDTATGTVSLKGHVRVEHDLTVEGSSNLVSEVYCGSNITVSGETDLKGEVRTSGALVGSSEPDSPKASK